MNISHLDETVTRLQETKTAPTLVYKVTIRVGVFSHIVFRITFQEVSTMKRTFSILLAVLLSLAASEWLLRMGYGAHESVYADALPAASSRQLSDAEAVPPVDLQTQHNQLSQHPAAASASSQNGAPSRAVLVNDTTGESFELPVVTTSFQKIGQNNYEAEYQVDIPTAILLGREDATISKTDPTLSVRLSIHQNFSQKYAHGSEWVAVYYYRGRWERLDPAVSVKSLQIKAQCFGDFEDGGFCNRTDTKMKRNPTSGTWYLLRPSWRGRYVAVGEAGAFQGGKTIATIKRGSTTWTFRVTLLNVGQW